MKNFNAKGAELSRRGRKGREKKSCSALFAVEPKVRLFAFFAVNSSFFVCSRNKKVNAGALPLSPRDVAIFSCIADTERMNDFLKGMNTIGELYPPAIPLSDCPAAGSAWQGVAYSFFQAGNDLRFAMAELVNARRESGQRS